MRDTAGAAARCVNQLPLGAGVAGNVLFHHLVNAGEIEAPHRRNRAFFQVASTMYIQAVKYRQVYFISLGSFKFQHHQQ